MAIVKSLPGFEVTIVTNGRALTEYVDNSQPDQDRKTTRYIEALSNQVFEIQITAKKGALIQGGGLAASMYADGKYASGVIVAKGTNEYRDHVEVERGVQSPLDTIREFCFASLESAQDERVCHEDEEKLSELGTIRVDLAFVRNLRRLTELHPSDAGDLGIVSKKALVHQDRPISHSIGYKPAVKIAQTDFWDVARVNPSENGMSNITFHYASKTSLQYANIIPRTPSPPPLEDKEDPTRDEVKQLQAQIKELKRKQAEQDKIKQESDTENKAKRRRKVAQTSAGVTQFVLGEDGTFTQQSNTHLKSPKEAPIEILSDDET